MTHHTDQVTATVLSSQLLLPIILCNDRTQSTTENNEGAVGLVSLSKYNTSNNTISKMHLLIIYCMIEK